jgi:hypothetical protein
LTQDIPSAPIITKRNAVVIYFKEWCIPLKMPKTTPPTATTATTCIYVRASINKIPMLAFLIFS